MGKPIDFNKIDELPIEKRKLAIECMEVMEELKRMCSKVNYDKYSDEERYVKMQKSAELTSLLFK